MIEEQREQIEKQQTTIRELEAGREEDKVELSLRDAKIAELEKKIAALGK